MQVSESQSRSFGEWAAVAVLVGAAARLPAGAPELPKDDPKKDPESKPEVVEVTDGFPLPAGAVRRFGNRQMRHPDGVQASACSSPSVQ